MSDMTNPLPVRQFGHERPNSAFLPADRVDLAFLSAAEIRAAELDVRVEAFRSYVRAVSALLTGPKARPVFIPEDPFAIRCDREPATADRGTLLVPHAWLQASLSR
jgi:hypothetical protein